MSASQACQWRESLQQTPGSIQHPSPEKNLIGRLASAMARLWGGGGHRPINAATAAPSNGRATAAASTARPKGGRLTSYRATLDTGGIKIEHSKLFWIQAMMVWVTLCLPGNIFTLVLYHRTSAIDSVSTHFKTFYKTSLLIIIRRLFASTL